jgi:hypothetical protein
LGWAILVGRKGIGAALNSRFKIQDSKAEFKTKTQKQNSISKFKTGF